MFGTDARRRVGPDKRIHPLERYGIKLMSMGFFLDEQSPVIWRGPIVMGIVRQFLRDVEWGELDLLVVDLPPGTGDAPLTLVQQVPVAGAVVVTTPQDVALLDVGRGMAMFAQVNTPVLGVVENMSGYLCPRCGTEDPIFGRGGAAALAARFGVPGLGPIPPSSRTSTTSSPRSARSASGFSIRSSARPCVRSTAACPTPTTPRRKSSSLPRRA